MNVYITTSQDVGRVMNPLQMVGQIEGGTVQGLGLALMEEMIIEGGLLKNPSFIDYHLPTATDAPKIRIAALVEHREPGAPFGAKGVGESPIISSPAAIAAAVRQATGVDITRLPIHPQDIALRWTGKSGSAEDPKL